MESDKININENNDAKKKNSNNMIKIKDIIINIILFLFAIFIIFYTFNNIDNGNILKQILKNIDRIINDTSLYNASTKNNDIKNKINLLRRFTNNNPFKYKHMEDCLLNDPDQFLCIYSLIYPKRVIGKTKILVGGKSDGCYVLLDDFENVRFTYSFGISDKIQFDTALARRGIDIYIYDHTIESLPYNDTKFHWSKIGISGKNEATDN